MRAFTITIENNSKLGKTVVMADSLKEARNMASKVCPAGFKVKWVQENELPQQGRFAGSPRAPRCALGGIAEQGMVHKPRRTPAFWNGKKTGDFRKC